MLVLLCKIIRIFVSVKDKFRLLWVILGVFVGILAQVFEAVLERDLRTVTECIIVLSDFVIRFDDLLDLFWFEQKHLAYFRQHLLTSIQ